MPRNRRSAKDAGARFERMISDYLAGVLGDPIERRAKNGSKDRGDITGLFMRGRRVVVECKDRAKMELSQWLREAEVERGNDDAAYGIVVHKRRGVADPAQQYVTMTLGTFAAMCVGGPEYLLEDEDE